jgi:hypothetical protein
MSSCRANNAPVLNRIAGYLKDRLKEPSTWRGLVLVMTALGYTLTDEQQTAIVTLGLGLAGMIGALSKDSK